MQPKYEEQIEIIPNIDGTLLCSLSWREHTFQEVLPRGIDRWPKKDFKAHIKNIVIPKLRIQLLTVQRKALDELNSNPEVFVPSVELSQIDLEKIRKANDKRARKTARHIN